MCQRNNTAILAEIAAIAKMQNSQIVSMGNPKLKKAWQDCQAFFYSTALEKISVIGSSAPLVNHYQ